MTRPVLFCQGFQRAFIDNRSSVFSASASARRGTCERLLKHARAANWGVVHSFLEVQVFKDPLARSIDGFAPAPTEPYVRQRTLSGFDATGLANILGATANNPIFFISFAGLSAIATTFLDGLKSQFPIQIVVDAVADFARVDVSEHESLAAIETLARVHGRAVESADLVGVATTSLPLGSLAGLQGVF